MKDFAASGNPAVQAQLDRLARLSLPQGRFGLETIRTLLARLNDPQRHIPPAFHVAGTNGKGSTCAYLRAMLEAEGLSVHAATKPHLVRYNERIRLAGELIADDMLAGLLAEVLDAGEELGPSFFEVTTAAMFLAFARKPADVCVIEVGLGGRFDATNVLETAVACGVASLGIDHEAFLLSPEDGAPADPMARIAFEKASIARPGVPLVTQAYAPQVAQSVAETAAAHGARLVMRNRDWWAGADGAIRYRDRHGELELPLPALAGAHQADNAALAVAMIRHQDRIDVSERAMAEGIPSAHWPARLQRLDEGPLTALAPGRTLWLDGGHNADAGAAIARFFGGAGVAHPQPLPQAGGEQMCGPSPSRLREGQRDLDRASEPSRSGVGKLHLILGMLSSKDPSAILAPLASQLASVSIVPAPGHEAHASADFAPFTSLPVRCFATVPEALAALPADGREVLIAGSLYLAGEVLRLNREFPD